MGCLLTVGSVWLLPRDSSVPSATVRFEETAELSGCLHTHALVQLADDFQNIMPWLSSVGAAAAAADYDADGDADLYVTDSGRGRSNRLFRNRGDGSFDDVTERTGVGCGNPEGASMHAIFGDIDNDGDLDLYVGKWAEPNAFFRNEGDGTFTDVSVESGTNNWGYANGATFLDFDRDGRLDLLVGNYFAEKVQDAKTGEWVRNDLWHPVSTRVMHETFTHARNGGRNVLYRNRGDGTFQDVTEQVGLLRGGWTLSVGSGDLNNDGWPDLYIANDFGPDEFYLNTGATENPPKFRVVVDPRGHPGVGNDWWKGMNIDMADVNNDGYLDMYVTNILERRYKTDEGNMLWLNCVDPLCPGGRGFKNIAQASGTQDGGWGWGGKFVDFNLDGLIDIYTVNGFATGDPNRNYWFQIQEMVTQTKNQTADARDWPVMGDRDLSGHERGRLFMQQPRQKAHDRRIPDDGIPHFLEMAEAAGITDRFNGRGIAVADFNLDGYPDFYVANQGARSTYYLNRSAPALLDRQRDQSRDRKEAVLPHDAGPAFLRLTLRGRPDAPFAVGDRRFASTANAVGARVTLFSRDGLQIREVQGGMGFASQSEYAVLFGVPDPTALEKITIRWPSGRMEERTGDAAKALLNEHSTITESVDEVAQR